MPTRAQELKQNDTLYYISGEKIYRGKILKVKTKKNNEETHIEAEFYDRGDPFTCSFMAFSPSAIFENIFTNKEEAKQHLKTRVSKLIKYTKKQIERQERELKTLKADLSKYQKRYEKLTTNKRKTNETKKEECPC